MFNRGVNCTDETGWLESCILAKLITLHLNSFSIEVCSSESTAIRHSLLVLFDYDIVTASVSL